MFETSKNPFNPTNGSLIPSLRHSDTYKKQLSPPPRNPLSTSLGISHENSARRCYKNSLLRIEQLWRHGLPASQPPLGVGGAQLWRRIGDDASLEPWRHQSSQLLPLLARLVVSRVGEWVDEQRFGCRFTLWFARRTLVVRVLPDDRQGIERAEGRRTAAIRPCRVLVSPFVPPLYRFSFLCTWTGCILFLVQLN